jgi:hypothetical protein
MGTQIRVKLVIERMEPQGGKDWVHESSEVLTFGDAEAILPYVDALRACDVTLPDASGWVRGTGNKLVQAPAVVAVRKPRHQMTDRIPISYPGAALKRDKCPKCGIDIVHDASQYFAGGGGRVAETRLYLGKTWVGTERNGSLTCGRSPQCADRS